MDLACRKLHEAHGRPPLLVMPPEYMNEVTVPNHTSSSNPANQAREQEVTPAERAYMRAWRAGGVGLWVCPEGTSDDWYWMYATVVAGMRVYSPTTRCATTRSACSHRATLPGNALGLALDGDMGGRGRKPRGLWRRWRSRHLVRFDFSHGASQGRPEPMLTLTEPPAFSGACTGMRRT